MKPFATESDLTLLLDEHKYYFRGDHVRGRLAIQPSTKPHKLTGIRLTFSGLVKTYINSKKKDHHYFFNHVLQLPLQSGTLLQVRKTYTYPFDFILPVENALPSCTESDTNTGGIIEYVIKATMERSSPEWSSSSLTTSLHVPVLERLNVSQTKLSELVWNEVTWNSTEEKETITDDSDNNTHVDHAKLSASIPHQGYIRDQKIPVTVDIHHFQPYQKAKALTISLIRCTRVLCKEKAYLLPPTVICSTKVDIDVKKTSGQTITQSLLIPRHISPTIHLNARLLQVDYRIEVRADMDPQENIAPWMMTISGLRCMCLELPVVIGTLSISSTLSPPLPPDLLEPKFVKGVKHVKQENLPRPNVHQSQHRKSRSRLCSLTPMDLPYSLFDMYASTNILWDRLTPRPSPSSSSSTSKSRSPTPTVSPSSSSPMRMHRLPPRRSLVLGPLPPSPTQSFHLTISLGESFGNLVQSGIKKNQQHRVSLDSAMQQQQRVPSMMTRRSSEPTNIYQPPPALPQLRERKSSLPMAVHLSPLYYKPDSTIAGLELDAAMIEPWYHDIVEDDDDDDSDDELANGCFLYIAPGALVDDGPFEKPNEISDGADSDDDDDDFISILARRESNQAIV